MSGWAWVQPQLSYEGRTLVANNLAASMLSHTQSRMLKSGFKSLRLLEKLMEEVKGGLSGFFRVPLEVELVHDQRVV